MKKMLGWMLSIAAVIGAALGIAAWRTGRLDPILARFGNDHVRHEIPGDDDSMVLSKGLERLQAFAGPTAAASNRNIASDLYQLLHGSVDDLEHYGGMNALDANALRSFDPSKAAEFDLTKLEFGRAILKEMPSDFSGSVATVLIHPVEESVGLKKWATNVEKSSLTPEDVLEARRLLANLQKVGTRCEQILKSGRYLAFEKSQGGVFEWREDLARLSVAASVVKASDPMRDTADNLIPIFSLDEGRALQATDSALAIIGYNNPDIGKSLADDIRKYGPIPRIPEGTKQLLLVSLQKEHDRIVKFYSEGGLSAAERNPPLDMLKRDYEELKEFIRVLPEPLKQSPRVRDDVPRPINGHLSNETAMKSYSFEDVTAPATRFLPGSTIFRGRG